MSLTKPYLQITDLITHNFFIMDENTCKNYEKCPIFNGTLQGMEVTAKTYRKQYCDAGLASYSKCKRYIVKEQTGQCPPNLLPNSLKTVEDIIKLMSL